MKKRPAKTTAKQSAAIPLTNTDANAILVARSLNRMLDDYFGIAVVKKIVAYYRVSTSKQAASGLGLEAQKAAVKAFQETRGGELLASYEEVESGKNADRPQLAKALAHAKRSKAVLVVAKLDRLARNVAFLSRLMESSVEFVAIDLEHANRLTIHILSAVAEGEAKAISERTKAGLAAAKARGMKLGSARPGHWKGREHLRVKGAAKASAASAVAHRKAADEAYTDIAPQMKQLRDDGKSFQGIADALNDEGHATRRGKPWNASQVLRVLARFN